MPQIQTAVGALRAPWTAAEAPSTAPATEALPLSHRLSIIYIATPVVIWVLGWFKWWVGVPIVILLIAGLWKALSGSWQVSLSLPVFVSFLIALAWILVNPIGGLWQSAYEITIHYNIMLDLGRGEWPTYLTDFLNDDPPLLSYYLGWHIVPGLIGKWLGPTALSWVIPLWTWIGIGLIVVIFTRGLPTLRTTLLAALVLVFLSGLDVINHLLYQGPIGTLELALDRLNDNQPLGLNESTPLYLKYQSNSETIWWSPQHLIASGLVSLIILQSRHQSRFAAISGLVITICAFWSTLTAVGLIPLVVALIYKNGLRPFLKWPNLIAAPSLALLMALYLLSRDSALIHFGWLWEYYTSHTQMIIDLIIFYLTEFFLLVVLLWMIDRRIVKEPIFIASIIVLLVVPWYVFGHWYFNSDILIRCSVPALFVLNYYTARAVISRLPEATSSHIYGTSNASRPLYASLIAVLAVGTITVLFIFLRSGNRPPAAYTQTANTSLISTAKEDANNRIVNTVPGLLQSILRDHDQKGLTTGEPIVSSRYDIYHQDRAGMLVYRNRDCVPELERSTRFFLNIYPVNIRDLPEKRKQFGYDVKETRWDVTYEGGYNCIGVFGLPSYEMTHVSVGQYYPYLGDVHWRVEYRLDDTSQPVVEYANRFDPTDKYQYYYFYYQLVATEEPEIRSPFNVHLVTLHQNALFFTREPCVSQDIQPNFFLHIFPVNIDDLPSARQQSGFDNYDFQFEENGVVFDDKCLAIIPVPDYDIARIRTGQFDPAQDRILWQGEITPQSTNLK